jgi:hypothetical protein
VKLLTESGKSSEGDPPALAVTVGPWKPPNKAEATSTNNKTATPRLDDGSGARRTGGRAMGLDVGDFREDDCILPLSRLHKVRFIPYPKVNQGCAKALAFPKPLVLPHG